MLRSHKKLYEQSTRTLEGGVASNSQLTQLGRLRKAEDAEERLISTEWSLRMV